MPRKWIDKKSAVNFNLVHRPQNDPFIHDDTVPSMILHHVAAPNSQKPGRAGKPKTLIDLERELDLDDDRIRENEGEAANHGIYYDDTEYDYMQHLRDLGEGGGVEVGFAEELPVTFKGKGKGKGKVMRLEDALRESSLEDNKSEVGSIAGTSSALGDDFLPSSSLRKTTYQDQQDVPDVIAGFQPDMDPRLREALEALEDEAFVDDQDEDDIFGSLVEGGRADEVTQDEFEYQLFDEEDGWESDATERPNHPEILRELPRPKDLNTPSNDAPPVLPPEDPSTAPPESTSDGDWLAEFSKFKQASKSAAKPAIKAQQLQPSPASIQTSSTQYKPVKKRKGALTNSSAYSMTSSSLARTDGQRLLDARFDRIEAMYNEDIPEEGDDEDGGVSVSGRSTSSQLSRASAISRLSKASGVSEAPSLIEARNNGALRTDFDSMMDDFLGGFGNTKSGKSKSAAVGASKKERRESRYKNGMRMLDEVRGDLGPARLKGKV